MSIEKQKILRFIPVINFITAAFWVDLVMKNKIPMTAIFRPLIKSMICVVVFLIPRIILDRMLDDVLINTIVFYVATYLTDLAIAFIFVDDQIKLQKKIDEKNDQN